MIDSILGAASEAKANAEFMAKAAQNAIAAYEARLRLGYQGWVKLTTDGSFAEPKISFEEFRAMKELDLL